MCVWKVTVTMAGTVDVEPGANAHPPVTIPFLWRSGPLEPARAIMAAETSMSSCVRGGGAPAPQARVVSVTAEEGMAPEVAPHWSTTDSVSDEATSVWPSDSTSLIFRWPAVSKSESWLLSVYCRVSPGMGWAGAAPLRSATDF